MTNEKFPQVGLLQTEDRRLFSSITKMEYQLAVRLPDSYADSPQSFPVLFVLDGDMLFGAAVSLTQLSWVENIPEMIVVGIGYGTFEKLGLLRELDFKVPEVQDEPKDSHADHFLAALHHEIIPFIEKNYRTKPDERILSGYSSGGFFAIYALLNEPGLFRSYLAGSPDTDLSCPYLQAHDQKLTARETGGPIDVFLSVGSLEDGASQSSVGKFHELVETIRTRKYPHIHLSSEVYEGENHGAVGIALSLIHGLQAYFSSERGG